MSTLCKILLALFAVAVLGAVAVLLFMFVWAADTADDIETANADTAAQASAYKSTNAASHTTSSSDQNAENAQVQTGSAGAEKGNAQVQTGSAGAEEGSASAIENDNTEMCQLEAPENGSIGGLCTKKWKNGLPVDKQCTQACNEGYYLSGAQDMTKDFKLLPLNFGACRKVDGVATFRPALCLKHGCMINEWPEHSEERFEREMYCETYKPESWKGVYYKIGMKTGKPSSKCTLECKSGYQAVGEYECGADGNFVSEMRCEPVRRVLRGLLKKA